MKFSKKCFIWGAGELGCHILPFLEKEGVEVVAFGDNDINKLLMWGNRLPVYAEDIIVKDLKDEKVDFIIIAIKNPDASLEVAQHLYNRGVKQIKIAPGYLNSYIKENKNEILLELEDIHEIKPVLEHIEVDISEICNLNCKGCGHYSNVIDKQRKPFLDLKEFKKDVEKLSELFSSIKLFALLGGEPLLNPNLDKYILIVRDFFPKTKIQILTNGLLIENLSEEIMKTIRRCNVEIHISLYPPTKDKIFEIQRFLYKNSITYFIRPYASNYFYRGIVKPENFKHIQEKINCPCSHIHYLYDSKVYSCASAALINKYNRIFDMKINDGAEDYVDIHKEGIIGWDIERKFSVQYSMCDWCNVRRVEYYKWESGGSISKEDWLQQNS